MENIENALIISEMQLNYAILSLEDNNQVETAQRLYKAYQDIKEVLNEIQEG